MKISEISWQYRLSLPAAQRLNYRASYDYRLKKKDGAFVRLLQQTTPLELDEKGNITYMLIVSSDITYFKKSTGIVFTLSSLDGKTCSVYDFEERSFKGAELPSEREKDVLRLMAKGYSSKLIAAQLNLSYHTVVTHRHNMLTKTHCKNAGELVQFALSSGVI
jgi:DNA-binding CsgD family transcriptional regulator